MKPILFYIGDIPVPSYFVILSVTYCIGIYWFFKRAKSLDLNGNYALDFALIIMIFGFLGGRLFHVFYEYPGYYAANPLRMLYVWQGGFVFFGGAIAAAIACYIVAKLRKQPFWVWADIAAPVLALCYGLGRIASFLSGSCYGEPTTLPWGVIYPEGVEAPPGVPLHPAALYETLWSFLSTAVLLHLGKRPRGLFKIPGSVFSLALVLHGVGRIMLEYIRADFRGELLLGFTISTWISAALIGWGLLSLVTTATTRK